MRKVEPGAVEMVPVGPFAAWLAGVQAREGIDKRALAVRVGLSYRSMTAYMAGERSEVALETVELALIEEGTATLMDVYPDLYEEVAHVA